MSLKSEKEIDSMRRGGKILGLILAELEKPLIPYDIYLRHSTRHWDAFLKRVNKRSE